jgi:hypothetical protein
MFTMYYLIKKGFFHIVSPRTRFALLVLYAMMRTCSSYDVTRHENGGAKIRTEIAKNRDLGRL